MADEKVSPGSSAKKKKSKYYYYVSSQSDEADTLKDKFWRNLEEGKIDVMQTPDLYSKVKCNKKPLGLFVNSFGNVESPVSTFDCSPSSSCGSSTKSIPAPFSVSGYETGSLLSNSPLVDSPMHSPFRSIAPEFGHPLISYDPQSVANITPEQNIWEDLDRSSSTSSTVIISTWQSAGESGTDTVPSSSSGLGNLLECVQPYNVLPDTDDTLICAINGEAALKESKKKIFYHRHFAAKRFRNNNFSSHRKLKTKFLDLSSLKALDSARKNVTTSNCLLSTTGEIEHKEGAVPSKSKRSMISSNLIRNVRSKRKQFYTYVDVGSEEADTLKDKFWRNLEQGLLDFNDAGDLYSKVKGNRKSRPWNSSSQINYDAEDLGAELSSACGEQETSTSPAPRRPVDRPFRRRDRHRRNKAEKRRGWRMAESAAPVVMLSLPVAYVDLMKTGSVPPALVQIEKTEAAEVVLLSEEDEIQKIESPQVETDPDVVENETVLLPSSVPLVSSDSTDKRPVDLLRTSTTSQNTSDSKLLGTCEVTVERLRPNKETTSEETKEIVPNYDHVTENCSVTRSPESQTTDSVISLPCKTIQELTDSVEIARDEPQESDCFDNIDFDPSSPLDDLCPSSDVEFSDLLELTASVAGSTADMLTQNAAILKSVSEVGEPSSKQPVASPSSESLALTSDLYSKMKNKLADPINIFDYSWPKSFLSEWGVYMEDAFKWALNLDDQEMAVELLQVMPSKSFDLEKYDSTGRSFLMQTVEQGQTEIVSALINRGVLMNTRGKHGYTPLMMAAERGHSDTAKVLLDSGAHIDLSNSRGETALMLAVSRGCLAVIELLLLNGANFSLTNFNHQTATSLAKINNRNDIFDLLNVHINRLTQKLWSVITQTLSGVGEIVSKLFPVQCFSLRDATSFTVRFLNHGRSSDDARSILFIGHTIIGEHNINCVLHGPCAVRKVTLNGKDLYSFSREGMFLMAFDCLLDGSNELIIHTIENRNSELKLLVCAYLVQPCDTRTDPQMAK